MKSDITIINGNQAAAHIAHKVNECCVIYPITPASEMSELAEEWTAEGRKNIFGGIPEVIEMQSEAGVAGAMHGVIQTGTLATTFTASQGLLLMMPNMYRIAGELTPNVIHVATRSIASHALSVFGDHSDIMAVRSTGYAFLGAASVQEAMDFALIAHAASLSSSIPFVHFFDGFRTSHEYNSITPVRDEVIQKMIDPRDLTAFRNRALSPDNPFIRGTAQGPDVFFQSREAVNATYLECADKVSQKMELFGRLTGRYYKPFEYIGHPDAERVVIAMGSACHTLEQTVNHLNEQGQKTGLIKVRLFRPFGTSHLLGVLPESCRRIAVLDRTKEPGSAAEPLCLDVIQSLESASYHPEKRPQVIGGRYGLASKEFTPAMALAIFKELSQTDPIDGFTVGIDDDLTHKSLSYKEQSIQIQNGFECLIYADKNDESNKSLNALLSVLESNGSHYVQAYTECSYKKSKSISTTHLRVDSKPINAPYLIEQANLVCCDQSDILAKTDLIDRVKPGGKLLVVVDDEQANPWSQIDAQKQNKILSRDIKLVELRRSNSLKSGTSIDQIKPVHSALLLQKELNLNMELTLNLSEVPARNNTSHFGKPESVNIEGGINRSLSFTQQLVAGNGDSLAVSEFPVDGTYPSNTSNYRKSQNAVFLPKWDPEACTQCGACTIACPLAALRAKIFETEQIDEAPTQFMSSSSEILQNQEADLMYTIQVNADQCDSCNLCVESCEEEALKMVPADKIISDAKENWKFFESLPEIDPSLLELDKLEHLALREPLFKYPDGDQGCGQAAYLKMISQLYGDRMLVANATGSSSIFGGAIPTTPWSQNQYGQGPAWSNSLFEDNAEFGLGFRLSLDFQRDQALSMLNSLDQLPADLEISKIIDSSQKTESEIAEQRRRVNRLKDYLSDSEDPIHLQLHEIADALVKKSVWIVGGDGWAYDVGFGGLDHAVSTGRNINILILDNEVYDNTGGQMSKSTPRGASAKFAMKGKRQKKKDLAQMLMSYEDVYIASIAIGADKQQSLKAIVEAEQYDGPSVIIAYCHCKAHGVNHERVTDSHRMAVNSGRWLLYRYDPERIVNGMNPLQLDSEPPSIPVKASLSQESRFDALFQKDDDELNAELSAIQNNVDRRYSKYLAMSAKMNEYVGETFN